MKPKIRDGELIINIVIIAGIGIIIAAVVYGAMTAKPPTDQPTYEITLPSGEIIAVKYYLCDTSPVAARDEFLVTCYDSVFRKISVYSVMAIELEKREP